MDRIAISARLEGEAAEPSGDPPQTNPRAATVTIQAVTADGSPARLERASYRNDVIFTGESTFTESGTISFNEDEGEVDIATVGEGTLGPSAEPGVLQGAVIWRITEGRGRFEGAAGLITSNFLLHPETGKVDEWQHAVVFVP